MLKELAPIVARLKNFNYATQKAALAKVVKVKGSAYRRPGARMLIMDDGEWIGAISGGSLEGDAFQQAKEVMNEGVPRLVTYHDNVSQQLQSAFGCEGKMVVLFEPATPEIHISLIDCLDELIKDNQPAVLASIIGTSENKNEYLKEKLLYDGKELLRIGNFPGLAEMDLLPAIEEAFINHASTIVQTDTTRGQLELFIEYLKPNISLYVFGSSYDVAPVVNIAQALRWNVKVIDNLEELPIIHKCLSQIEKVDPDKAGDYYPYDERSAVIVMSHNYEFDLNVLKSFANTRLGYLGLLGPVRRFDKMKPELIAAGWTQDGLRRIYNPLGLDIGAETADEIALSVIAGVQAAINEKDGRPLANKGGFIHNRIKEDDPTFA